MIHGINITKGAQWLNGRVLDSRPRGRGFEPHRRHCVVSLSKNINPSLVLVQPRKTRPCLTERLLIVRKESNQTNKNYYLAIEELKSYICVGSFMNSEGSCETADSPERLLLVGVITQVNRMSKSRRVLATGGKQRIFWLHMVCFEMVLYHNEPC